MAYCDVFCHRFSAMRQPVATCFVIKLLYRVVTSSIVSFFVSFLVTSSNGKVQFDIVIKSNLIRHYVPNMES